MKTEATLYECGPFGVIRKEIFVRNIDKANGVLWFTEGRKRKEEGKRLRKDYLLLCGNVSLDYPLPYTEKIEGNMRVQESRYCCFDPRYAEEFREWVKGLDRGSLEIMAEG